MIESSNYFINGVKNICNAQIPMDQKPRLFKQYGKSKQETHRLNPRELS